MHACLLALVLAVALVLVLALALVLVLALALVLVLVLVLLFVPLIDNFSFVARAHCLRRWWHAQSLATKKKGFVPSDLIAVEGLLLLHVFIFILFCFVRVRVRFLPLVVSALDPLSLVSLGVATLSHAHSQLTGALELYEWCHGAISRNGAQYLLKEHNVDGMYLVRESQSQPGQVCLCVFSSSAQLVSLLS